MPSSAAYTALVRGVWPRPLKARDRNARRCCGPTFAVHDQRWEDHTSRVRYASATGTAVSVSACGPPRSAPRSTPRQGPSARETPRAAAARLPSGRRMLHVRALKDLTGGCAMQNLDHSPAATANAGESRPQASRPRGRRETPWAAYAIKGGLATLAITAIVGLVFALSSGVWASAIAAVVALLALAAVARPTWRMLDATYGRPARGPRPSTESSGATHVTTRLRTQGPSAESLRPSDAASTPQRGDRAPRRG